MKAKQKESAAKWILATGTIALFLVSLTSPVAVAPATEPTTSHEISQDAEGHDLARKSYRSFYHFVASLC